MVKKELSDDYESPEFRDLSKFCEDYKSALQAVDKADLGVFWLNKDKTGIIHFKTVLHNSPDQQIDFKALEFPSYNIWDREIYPYKSKGQFDNCSCGHIYYANERFFVETNFDTNPQVGSFLCDYFKLPANTIISKYRFDFSGFDWVTGQGEVFDIDIVTGKSVSTLNNDHNDSMLWTYTYLSTWNDEKEKFRAAHPELVLYDDNDVVEKLSECCKDFSRFIHPVNDFIFEKSITILLTGIPDRDRSKNPYRKTLPELIEKLKETYEKRGYLLQSFIKVNDLLDQMILDKKEINTEHYGFLVSDLKHIDHEAKEIPTWLPDAKDIKYENHDQKKNCIKMIKDITATCWTVCAKINEILEKLPRDPENPLSYRLPEKESELPNKTLNSK
jgi:hypothetical protein